LRSASIAEAFDRRVKICWYLGCPVRIQARRGDDLPGPKTLPAVSLAIQQQH
jgi:hypothetical protein